VSRWGDLTAAVNVDYTTKDGTAKAGVDYTAASGKLSFAPGETERTISIPLGEDNGLLDGNRWFSFLLTGVSGGAVIEPSEVTVFIQDNEVPANLDYSFNPVISPNYGEPLSFATPSIRTANCWLRSVLSSALTWTAPWTTPSAARWKDRFRLVAAELRRAGEAFGVRPQPAGLPNHSNR